tara:strand:- start:6176 stop:6382 length:207 start_codon:yes stop_codon:yes gene_type:complete
MEKLVKIKLSKSQIELVEHEFRMRSILEPNFEKQLSRKLWNELKRAVYVTFEDGHFVKAETESSHKIW